MVNAFNWKLHAVMFVFVLVCLNTSQASANTNQPELLRKLDSLSVPFVKNQGQVSNEISFYAKTFGGTVFVTNSGEILYSLPKRISDKYTDRSMSITKTDPESTLRTVVLREIIVNGRIDSVEGVIESITKVNYFRGSSFNAWLPNIESFHEVSLVLQRNIPIDKQNEIL